MTCGGLRSLPVPECDWNPNLSRNIVSTQGTAFSKTCVTRHPSLMYSHPSSLKLPGGMCHPSISLASSITFRVTTAPHNHDFMAQPSVYPET